MRLLVVDDMAVNRTLLVMWLQRMLPAAEVVEADSGREALLRCHEVPPDGVLLDYRMPDMDGGEVTERLRELSREWGKQVPVILITADASTSLDGVADVLVHKPVHASGVMLALASAGLLHLDGESTLTRQVGGVAEELRHLLPRAAETLRDLETQAVQAFAVQDWTGLAHIGHSLAGVGGNFGMGGVVVVGEAIEAAAERHEAVVVPQLLDWLAAALNGCEAECR